MKTKSQSRKKLVSAQADFQLLSVVLFGLIALSAVALVFYLLAALSFQHNLAGLSGSAPKGSQLLESSNYHGMQAPSRFPAHLIRARSGKLISSQELMSQGVGSLDFVSFPSRDSVAALASFYREFLWRGLYEFREQTGPDQVRILRAGRGNASLDFHITPAAQGSVVAIYYWLVR